MIAAPPSEAGAVKAMVAWPLPGVAERPVGAPGVTGVLTGVTLTALDAVPAPTLFKARSFTE